MFLVVAALIAAFCDPGPCPGSMVFVEGDGRLAKRANAPIQAVFPRGRKVWDGASKRPVAGLLASL
jgi:hypothetical protein